ncbi:DUF4124 domain-containing protein [Pseudoalteromonas mariniglutinosa]|uniref:DUF4124 domain-containing protein n=1 Tax=Pseudoalteromonas mariniglutinosa TaxID=206042 RepID=UPI00384BF3CB
MALFNYICIALLICFAIFYNPSINANTTYYKCVTERGTVFSQQPCSSQATAHTISTVDPTITAPKNFTKQLNQLEREQIIRNLEAEIRSHKHALAILSRDRDRAQFQQQQRLKRILSDDEIKRINKDIKKQLKIINKQYRSEVKLVDKKITRLEKKLQRYQ